MTSKFRQLIKEGKAEEAIHLINNTLSSTEPMPSSRKAELHYLLGNAYRIKGNFHIAMDCYTKAIEEDKDSPAVEARGALQDILSFYNKDMYNH